MQAAADSEAKFLRISFTHFTQNTLKVFIGGGGER